MSAKKLSGVVLAAIIMLVFVVAAIRYAFRTPVIAFYSIEEKTANAVQSAAGKDFLYTTYATELSLAEQLQKKKPDLLIVPSGNALAEATLHSKPLALDATTKEKLTSTIFEAIPQATDGNAKALPLLSSHFEIDINMDLLRASPVKSIATWNDIRSFSAAAYAQTNGQATIVFAAKDTATLLDLLGALAESLGGKHAYEEAVATITQAYNDANTAGASIQMDALVQQLTADEQSPLYPAVQFLIALRKDGLIAPGTFNLEKKALNTYLQAGMVSVAFMSLADHRALERNSIKAYHSYYFPSAYSASTRHFTAPIVYAVPLTKNKKVQAVAQLLLNIENQEALSRASGLAPVLAQCQVPDRQAEEARFWVAATNAPLAGLSRDIPLPAQAADELAARLNAKIRFDN